MKEEVKIVKVGGAVVEDEAQLAQLLSDFSAIPGRKVLVHGGGRKATKMAERLGIATRMVEGRRITDAAMLEVVTMVYGGLVNKNVVARLQAAGVNAIGLTGADGGIMLSHRRPPVPAQRPIAPIETIGTIETIGAIGAIETIGTIEAIETIDYGFVGDVDSVATPVLAALIEQGLVPVLAPLTHDGSGTLLNTNADTIAAEAAKALASRYDVTLIYAFEKPGVLRRPDDDSSVIPLITRDIYERYVADGTISGGMLPKLQNALAAVEAGVGRVIITQATAIDGTRGTVIASD